MSLPASLALAAATAFSPLAEDNSVAQIISSDTFGITLAVETDTTAAQNTIILANDATTCHGHQSPTGVIYSDLCPAEWIGGTAADGTEIPANEAFKAAVEAFSEGTDMSMGDLGCRNGDGHMYLTDIPDLDTTDVPLGFGGAFVIPGHDGCS